MRRESKQLERHLCSATVSETRRKAFSVKTLMEPQLKKTVKISSRWGKLRALSWGYITTLLLLRVFMRLMLLVCADCQNKQRKKRKVPGEKLIDSAPIQTSLRFIFRTAIKRWKKKKRCCDLWCIKQKTHVWSSDINRGENRPWQMNLSHLRVWVVL